MISHVFIDRPRLAIVISLVITIAGLISMMYSLPARRFCGAMRRRLSEPLPRVDEKSSR